MAAETEEKIASSAKSGGKLSEGSNVSDKASNGAGDSERNAPEFSTTDPSQGDSKNDAKAPEEEDRGSRAREAEEVTSEPGETTDEPSDNVAPPLPNEPPPEPEDDGWEPQWSAEQGTWYFFNRFTQQSQWENPRVPSAADMTAAAAAPGAPPSANGSSMAPPPLPTTAPVAGGYNPAIHGDYDPTAAYAQVHEEQEQQLQNGEGGAEAGDVYLSGGFFNRATGAFQQADQGAERHSDESKARRQMNAFFDVDAAANVYDGRSLKAERSGKKPSKNELKAFKEKRRAKKEEKRRAWLRD